MSTCLEILKCCCTSFQTPSMGCGAFENLSRSSKQYLMASRDIFQAEKGI